MKSIEEAAREKRESSLKLLNVSKLIDYVIVANREESAFKAGVEFAQRWIPVLETTAEEVVGLGEILIKDKSGEIEIAKLVKVGNIHMFEIKNSDTIIDTDDIVFLRPIELK